MKETLSELQALIKRYLSLIIDARRKEPEILDALENMGLIKYGKNTYLGEYAIAVLNEMKRLGPPLRPKRILIGSICPGDTTPPTYVETYANCENANFIREMYGLAQICHRTGMSALKGAVFYERLDKIEDIKHAWHALKQFNNSLQSLQKKLEKLQSHPCFEFKWSPCVDLSKTPLHDILKKMTPPELEQDAPDEIIFFILGFCTESMIELINQDISRATALLMASEFYSDCLNAMDRSVKASQSSWTYAGKSEKISCLQNWKYHYEQNPNDINLIRFVVETSRIRSVSFWGNSPASQAAFYEALSRNSKCLIHAKLDKLPANQTPISFARFKLQVTKAQEEFNTQDCIGENEEFDTESWDFEPNEKTM